MPMAIKDPKYGIPQLKKFPLPDARHVRSAIKFFNYAPPRYEKQLAAAILRRMKEYGLSFDDFTVGDENRFKRYVPMTYLAHHGILGMHCGIRRFQPYPKGYTGDGKFTGKNNKMSRKKKADILKIQKAYSQLQDDEDNLSTRGMVMGSDEYERWYTAGPRIGKMEDGFRKKYGESATKYISRKYLSSDSDSVFVSGSSKTQNPESEYYRKELPDEVKKKLDEYMKKRRKDSCWRCSWH